MFRFVLPPVVGALVVSVATFALVRSQTQAPDKNPASSSMLAIGDR